MKTYTFKNNNKTNNTYSFHTNTGIDYSSILDNLIATDIAKKNDYLFADMYFGPSSKIKINDDFAKAAKFLANYKKNNKKTYTLPFIYGKMYTLSDGTPIVFYDDEIQIGFDYYSYDSFNDLSFLNLLGESTKKTIINIYLNGTDAKININIK